MTTNRFKKILVPVSLEIESTTAFNQALFLKQKLGAEITLLHVVPNVGGISEVFQPDLKSEAEKKGMVRLVRFAKMNFEGKISEHVKLRVEVGNHVSIINSITSNESFDLLVLNRRNRIDALPERYKSNNVSQIVRESSCPVISVNNRWTSKGIRNILVPVDISRQSRDLLNWSILLGKIFNANIKLLAALTVKIDLTQSLAYKKSRLMKDLIESEGVSCSVSIVEKENLGKNEALIEEARKISADMLLVQGFQDLMFSNTQSERLLVDFLKYSSRPIFSLGIKEESFVSSLLKVNKNSEVLLNEFESDE
ncbi:universal stress protein [Marinifilum flexuosum]|uniref:Nucleotide-binding universal stress UspA family protein n=1 Tax=Marinifilum flexuosum TaxID=1117708 RepID=A0A419WTH9_9BACT|nr:universal stress protein [Marinifilum flexuosum]RKD98737.1 nucleotide-binding universal stress UspA family protein [Marinifilum flexuosum]